MTTDNVVMFVSLKRGCRELRGSREVGGERMKSASFSRLFANRTGSISREVNATNWENT